MTDGHFRAYVKGVVVEVAFRRRGCEAARMAALAAELGGVDPVALVCHRDHTNFYVRGGFKFTSQQAVDAKDPNLHDDAVRFDHLAYQDAVSRRIKVMDTSAFVLAGEQSLTMHIFDVAQRQLMRRICLGESLGTLITAAN